MIIFRGCALTNEELVAAFQHGTDAERRDAIALLWDQCERLVKWHANKWGSDGFEDRVQEGFLILHSAANDYDPEKNTAFSHYLGQRLSWGWIRKADTEGTLAGLSVRSMEQIKAYRRTVREYLQNYAREPSDNAVCCAMGINLTTLYRIKKAAAAAVVVSLDERHNADEDGATLLDTIPDENDFTEDVIEREQLRNLKRTIWPLVDELEERQAAVIWARFKEGKSFKEIGREQGVSPGRARVINDKALRAMRSGHIAKQLRPFVQDDVRYSKGTKGTSATRFQQTFTSATERAAIHMIERE